jgi:hypothetical protein
VSNTNYLIINDTARFSPTCARMLRRAALTMMPKLTRGMSKDARPMTR